MTESEFRLNTRIPVRSFCWDQINEGRHALRGWTSRVQRTRSECLFRVAVFSPPCGLLTAGLQFLIDHTAGNTVYSGQAELGHLCTRVRIKEKGNIRKSKAMLSAVTLKTGSHSFGSLVDENDDNDDEEEEDIDLLIMTDNSATNAPSQEELKIGAASLDQSDASGEDDHDHDDHEEHEKITPEEEDDDDDLMRRPPWEELPLPSLGRQGVYGSSGEISRESTVATTNPRSAGRRSRTNSRDSCSSSAVTFQLQPEPPETTSHYTKNTESNSKLESESDEGLSNLTGRQDRLLEISTRSTASAVSTVSATQDQILAVPSAAFNFAIEHRIFLKAALGLLTELDRHAPELGMMDPIVLKAGVGRVCTSFATV